MQAIMRRVWQLEDRGLELFFEGRTSLYLTLKTKAVRNRVEAVLLQQPALHLEKRRTRRAWTRDWLSGKVPSLPSTPPLTFRHSSLVMTPFSY